MIRVLVIKSGSQGNSIYVDDGEIGMLLDAGVNYKYTKAQLIKHGVYNKLDAVFISHQHSDHNKFQDRWKNHPNLKEEDIIKNHDVNDGGRLIKSTRGKSLVDIKTFKLDHDVDNLGLSIKFANGDTLLWATDTFSMNNVPERNYTVYLIESNHDENMKTEFDDGHISRAFKTHLSKQKCKKFLLDNVGNNTKLIHYLHLSTKYDNLDDCVDPINKEGIKEVWKSPYETNPKMYIVNENPFLLALDNND